MVMVAAMALGASGCGDDDDDEGAPAAEASVERYCELSRQLDRAGQKVFEDLEQDPEATSKDFEAAERQLVEENEEPLQEIQEVAPAEIRDDVATLVQALRARAGLGEPPQANSGAAERRITEFERESCD
jgi:non-homologous end joining protein Ku